MEKRTKVFVTFLFVIALVIFLYIFTNWFSIATGYFSGEDETAKIARCLNKQGAEFYGTTFCADCEKQLAIFGTAAQEIRYKDCGENKELCPNIREIPAWYINKQIHYGYKSLEELKQLSNCVDV